MPRRRILFWRVVRFNPSRSAAPPLPAIRPAAARNASMITLDSACLKLEGELIATTTSEEVGRAAIGTSSSSPRVTITARSMKFANSRMLPFHGQFVSTSRACLDIDEICFRIRAANFETKKLTSSGISSRRSRRGGNLDRENVETVEQILPKLLLLNHGPEVTMGRRDHPNIHLDRCSTSQALELLLLNGPQQFRLHLQADIANLIQKERASVCQLESTFSLHQSPRESSPLMPEQLAFQKSRGDGGAVHAYIGTIAT